MTTMNYIGLDIHKKTISYGVKDVSGRIHQEGKVGSTRRELDGWMKTLPQPWRQAAAYGHQQTWKQIPAKALRPGSPYRAAAEDEAIFGPEYVGWPVSAHASASRSRQWP